MIPHPQPPPGPISKPHPSSCHILMALHTIQSTCCPSTWAWGPTMLLYASKDITIALVQSCPTPQGQGDVTPHKASSHFQTLGIPCRSLPLALPLSLQCSDGALHRVWGSVVVYVAVWDAAGVGEGGGGPRGGLRPQHVPHRTLKGGKGLNSTWPSRSFQMGICQGGKIDHVLLNSDLV
jgi:hypothetical protein